METLSIVPRFICLFCIVFLVSSCTSTTRAVGIDEEIDVETAYVAAYLNFDYGKSALRLALEIDCSGEVVYVEIPRNREGDLASIHPIPSGACSVEGIAPMGGIGDIAPTAKFSGPRPYSIEACPGNVYYLGVIEVAQLEPDYPDKNAGAYSIDFRGRRFQVTPAYAPLKRVRSELMGSYSGFGKLEVHDVYPFNK